MKKNIVEAVNNLLKERGIDRALFQEIIEGVFFTIIRKHYGQTDNFTIIFNPEKGDIEIQAMKVVVEDDNVTDPATEISLSDAMEYDPYSEVGEETMVLLDYEKEFGRRAVTTARQNLMHRIREIEKDNVYKQFSQRIGEIIIGDVHEVNENQVRLNIDKNEVVMPRDQMVPTERYRRGDSIKALILDVKYDQRDPRIIVTRRHADFVRRLFELEVPEIMDGIVEIKAIAREAGERTKMAVDTNDKRIDPVGACVGMKGVRIQAIVKELNREKIEIIHWSPDPIVFLRRALVPIIPIEIKFFEDSKKVLIVVNDEQMPIAIGRRGQNVRLLSQLTKFDIEPVRMSDYYPDSFAEEELDLQDVKELLAEYRMILKKADLHTAEDVLTADRNELAKLPGLDEDAVKHIIEQLSSYFEETE